MIRSSQLSSQSPQSLLQLVLLLGCRLRSLGLGRRRRGLVELEADFQASIVGEFAQQFVDGVLADLDGCGLRDGVLVDAVGHGVFLVLLLELFQGNERLWSDDRLVARIYEI